MRWQENPSMVRFGMRPLIATLAAWGCFLVSGPAQVLAQSCTQLPPHRSVSDGRSGCLALVPVDHAPSEVGPAPGVMAGAQDPGAAMPGNGSSAVQRALVVMIHGDRTGTLEQRHIDRWMEVGRTLQAHDRLVLFMVRPGYRTPSGNSSGWANPRDDDYTAANVDRVAGALASLRQMHQAHRIVLVGHSGGAALAALVLGRHPGVADAALLLGCPCDVPPWRDHRNMQRGGGDRPWTNSLNPLSFVHGIPPGTPVLAATGSQDDNTLPRFQQRWVEAAASKGVRAQAEEVPGHDHGSILRWSGLPHRVQMLVDALPP
jgi:predicted esterase